MFRLMCFLTSFLILGAKIVCGQEISAELNQDWAYCFEFTWFGPRYNNFTGYDKTCDDYIDDYHLKTVPCAPPIVISYDGTPPNIDYLWTNYKNSVICRRAENDVCVKYTYLYNGAVSNVTYMCSRVISNPVVTSGCYTQTVDGYDVEMCVCQSSPGYTYKPCNKAPGTRQNYYLMIVALLSIVILNVIPKM